MKNEISECWDLKAKQWQNWVGENGDKNRFFNSDPVLWKMVGEPKELAVLDAGCGTGYLSIQLAKKGAKVTGVDLSEKMVALSIQAKIDHQVEAEFRVDSCSELSSIKNQSMDLIVSNYVLMDLPDLDAAVQNFYRVLRPTGRAVLVFSHPINNALSNDENYFDQVKKTERWGPFDSDFIYFHRPLSQYWKSFRSAGFTVVDFDEPVAQDPYAPGFKAEWRETYRRKPWSVAFSLQKK